MDREIERQRLECLHGQIIFCKYFAAFACFAYVFSTIKLGARAPSCISHTLVKDMSLNRGGTHFTLGLMQCIISSFLLQIYLCPLSNLPNCAHELLN